VLREPLDAQGQRLSGAFERLSSDERNVVKPDYGVGDEGEEGHGFSPLISARAARLQSMLYLLISNLRCCHAYLEGQKTPSDALAFHP